MTPELLYFADPMCSWCWGFSPVARQVAERYGEKYPIRVFVGGLAVGVDKPLTSKSKKEIRHHWEQVEKDTGQQFDYAFFARDNFIYNSALPSAAVVAVRNANLNALYFLGTLHRAFYQDNRDITDETVLIDIAGEVGLDQTSFRTQLTAQETSDDAEKDYALTKKIGIQGFPALLGMANNKIELLTMGYQDLAALSARIDQWGTTLEHQ
ncbi:MAG: DsbA family protein [Pseudomonadota bacterium]